MGGIAVFLGPTLCREAAARQLKAQFFPPAACGDIYRAVTTKRLNAIALIDGYFAWTPAVFHKEILFALESGVRVYGASSMGALRAAELAPFGMQGVGSVYSMFATGLLEDDDEVAVVHAPQELKFEQLSVAMVDIRHVLARAVRKPVLSVSQYDHLVSFAKRLHFSDRLWSSICREACQIGADCASLHDFIEAAGPSLKQLDAMELLSRLSEWQELDSWPPSCTPVDLHRTSYWLGLVASLQQDGAAEVHP